MDIEAIEVLETETQRIEQRRADLVVLAREDSREFLLHIEIQNDNLAEMPLRMLRYLTDLMLAPPPQRSPPERHLHRQGGLGDGRRYSASKPRFPLPANAHGATPPRMMKVALVRSLTPALSQRERGAKENTFTVIDMHQVDCKVFLDRNDPDALVLAILCDFKGRNEREVVREILTRLRALTQTTPQRFGDYLTMLEVLSTNRNLKDCIIEEEKMLNIAIEELPSYEIGMERGMERGMSRGNHETAEALLIRLLEAKFGALGAADRQTISNAPTAQLMDWSENALRASSIQEVFV